MHAFSHFMHKIGWRLKSSGKIFDATGEYLVEKFSNAHEYTSDALVRLDNALQKEIRLIPKTRQIEEDIWKLEGKKNLNGNAQRISVEVAQLKQRKELLDKLLVFDPLRLNHEMEKYAIFRVHANKSTHMFTKKFSTKKLSKMAN